MAGRVFEKNGETYIVSDNVETLDTENLVVKESYENLQKPVLQNAARATSQQDVFTSAPTLPFDFYLSFLFGEEMFKIQTHVLKIRIVKNIFKCNFLTTKVSAFKLMGNVSDKNSKQLKKLTLHSINNEEMCNVISVHLNKFTAKPCKTNRELYACKIVLEVQ